MAEISVVDEAKEEELLSFTYMTDKEILIEDRESGNEQPTRQLPKKDKLSSDPKENNRPSSTVLRVVRAFIGFIFFVVFLMSSVFSRLSLLGLTGSLRHTYNFSNISSYDPSEDQLIMPQNAITIYWQLLIVLIVPNILTFFRCLFFGVLGKTRQNFPWPHKGAVLLGGISAVFEVVSMCLLVYVVLVAFPTGVSILLLHGVFVIQIMIDIIRTFRTGRCVPNCCQKHRRNGYRNIENGREETGSQAEECNDSFKNSWLKFLEYILENWLIKLVAGIIQCVGVVVFIIWAKQRKKGKDENLHKSAIVALLLVLLCMSILWSSCIQKWIAYPTTGLKGMPKDKSSKRSARYKSSLMLSIYRLLLYPFVSYVIFRYVSSLDSDIDPWCLKSSCYIDISGKTWNIMVVHIVSSAIAYGVAWVSCTMTLNQISLGFPLLLSTPVSLGIYYIVWNFSTMQHILFPFYSISIDEDFDRYLILPYVCGSLFWLGGLVAMGFFISAKTNIILAKDEDMFLTPHYDSVFLDQHIILNRQVEQFKTNQGLTSIIQRERKARKIFICTTMFRENTTEMKQLLESISRVVKHYLREFDNNKKYCDFFESHIFFDGAMTGNQIVNFGLQLLSLLEETLDIKLDKGIKTETPYGYNLCWELGDKDKNEKGMPFSIHFKDSNKVKPKKRWSQVMYMNYIIKHRIGKEKLDSHDTFILTTDADIDFTADSVTVLLDMMNVNPNVAGVSARTHPKGHGPMYWYQLFDYAIGHWFQKPAEHILGSVLCSPGCFSVFRCSALEQVMEEYATEATNATEFLMKDMGEDRWLCTLIIKKGLRLDYCAISEDYTYCPTEFDEFYKQRRRWIPSTVANLIMLVTEFSLITRSNDSISILYILFQFINIFSTSIAPATVVLVIGAGLELFYIPIGVSVTIFFLVGVVYGLICLYASPKAQLDVAKILTFVFGMIMAMVVIGIFKNVVEEIAGAPVQKTLGPGDCSGFNHSDNDFSQCTKSAAFASHSENISGNDFQLPVSPTILYIGALAITFFLAGVMHFNEIKCLFHSVWFLLALPSGYLLLIIYSAANLSDRSWGTREQSNREDLGIRGWKKHLDKCWNLVALSRCFTWYYKSLGTGSAKIDVEHGDETDSEGDEVPERIEGEDRGKAGEEEDSKGNQEGAGCSGHAQTKEKEGIAKEKKAGAAVECHLNLQPDAEKWLKSRERECEMYLPNFKRHGYTTKYFIADMSFEDLEAISIDKAGYRHRLLREIKNLQTLPIHRFEIPIGNDEGAVEVWLGRLELGEYRELFHEQGYKTRNDMKALAILKEEDIRDLGVTKRAHLQRLLKAVKHLSRPPVADAKMTEDAREWLEAQECGDYVDNFTRHGYTTMHFLSGIEDKELEAVGIKKKGLQLRIQKAAQKLPSLYMNTDIPTSVEVWLEGLELKEYTAIFHCEGYKTLEDMEHLKELTIDQLKAMGIHKTAHLRRLKVALNYLAKPSIVDLNKRETERKLLKLETKSLNSDECTFWQDLIKDKLKPVAQKFTHAKDVQKSLQSLRNLVLAILLMLNLMWIVLLFSLNFYRLQDYGIDPRAFQLLFLAVYGFIIIIQFFAMIAHRAVTLIHYFGRVRKKDQVIITPRTSEELEQWCNIQIPSQ